MSGTATGSRRQGDRGTVGRVATRLTGRPGVIRIAVATVAILLVVALALALVWRADDSAARTSGESTSTARIERGTLTDRQSVSGTLTYDDAEPALANRSGTVTKAAAQGSRVKRGGVLWKINQVPTVLLYGNVPAYRVMREGDEGADVRQINRNLRALGYSGGADGGTYTAGTARAVESWQADRGVARTGVVALGDVLFRPGVVRVGSVVSGVGARVAPPTPVLQLSDTRRIVSVDLDTGQQSLAFVSEPVIVTLPDGSEVKGTVSEVGTTASATSAGSGGSDAGATNSDSTVPVTVTLNAKTKALRWEQAPVQVQMQSAKRDDVLIAPVTALLALREGGYAVEVVDGSGSTLVKVETGLFADGRVEISARGIRPGTVVRVPVSL